MLEGIEILVSEMKLSTDNIVDLSIVQKYSEFLSETIEEYGIRCSTIPDLEDVARDVRNENPGVFVTNKHKPL